MSCCTKITCLPATETFEDASVIPAEFCDEQVYLPPSEVCTSTMIRVPFLTVIRPSEGRVSFPLVHVTFGTGIPLVVQLIDSLVSISVSRFWPMVMLTGS